jgi:pimeloyl-ACP methyl ester carboxylesterase
VVFAHGQPGDRTGHLTEARLLREEGYGSLLLDLPGYGASEGRRTWDESYVETFLAAIEFVRAEHEDRIVAFGYSMGGWVVAEAAARDTRIRGVILRSAFTRLAPQLRYEYRTSWPGASSLAVLATYRAGVPISQLDTVAALMRIGERPTFVIGGTNDSVIPEEMTRELAAVSHGELWSIDGAGHVDLPEIAGADYRQRLRAFLERVLNEPR